MSIEPRRTSAMTIANSPQEAVQRLSELQARQQQLHDEFNDALAYVDGGHPWSDNTATEMQDQFDGAHLAIMTALGYYTAEVWKDQQERNTQQYANGYPTNRY